MIAKGAAWVTSPARKAAKRASMPALPAARDALLSGLCHPYFKFVSTLTRLRQYSDQNNTTDELFLMRVNGYRVRQLASELQIFRRIGQVDHLLIVRQL